MRSGPSFEDQVRVLEVYLGRRLPLRLLELYRDQLLSSSLLPLSSGREEERPPPKATPAALLLDATERLDSVLGHAMCDRAVTNAVDDEDHVWPNGLLTIEDVGCAIYHAVDLDDPQLRVIEYQHLDPSDDPERDASGGTLAYGEPVIPRPLQHRH